MSGAIGAQSSLKRLLNFIRTEQASVSQRILQNAIKFPFPDPPHHLGFIFILSHKDWPLLKH